MNKNWLIRTKSNHILGPVSKDKVIELYKNGSIKGDDEVCSGNGYWFFIREKDLIEKYLLGINVQPFNPISEAKDVLTVDPDAPVAEAVEEEDVTLVGKSLDLSALNEELPPPNIPAEKGPEIVHQHVPVHDVSQNKKKINKTKSAKSSEPKAPLKNDHGFIKYFGLFAFVLLLFLIYFRNTIMTYLSSATLIPAVYAQEASEEVQKKNFFLDQVIEIEGVKFKPDLGLEGLRIVSEVNTEVLSCSKLNDVVMQLGIILYPQDLHNESFLKRIRDCVIPLDDAHPVKKWIKNLGANKSVRPTPEQVEHLTFLDSLLNSGFNLITSPEQKTKIVRLINLLNGEQLPDRILQSYLYLLIGNIAQSDSLLIKTFKISPFYYWTKYPFEKTFWSEAISLRIEKIFERLSKHPADRTNFRLFAKYMGTFFNDSSLRESADQFFDEDEITEKMKLKVYQVKGGDFTTFLSYKSQGAKKRRVAVKSDVLNRDPKDFPWYWYFFKEFHNLPKNEKVLVLNPYFEDKSDDSQLFFLLMAGNDTGVMEAFYQGKGISEIKHKRQFYMKLFNDTSYWPLALLHLIEMGNINQEMVDKIMQYEN